MKKQYSSKQRKIHELKRENVKLSSARKAILSCKEHYNNAKYHYYCKDDFKKLFSISEKIGMNSAKIQRLRTQIQQEKKLNEHSSGA